MLCPKCKTENKFKRDGKAVYCVAKDKNGLCLYPLKAGERKNFNEEQDHILKKYQKKYQKQYYKNKKKYLSGISLKQIAVIKFCDYDTVLKNKKEFDIISGIKPTRVEFNRKVMRWWPND